MSGKKNVDALKQFDRDRLYTPTEALDLAKRTASATFDESIDVAVRLGVDPRKADQMVRGTVALPSGTGKDVRVAVFAAGDAAVEAREAGADLVGADDLAAQVEAGKFDFDVAIATPDMMPLVGRLGRVLGPRGLMPNPKTGTVTTDVGRAVGEFKGGKVEYRTDRYGNVHVPLGKASFEPADLEKAYAPLDAVRLAKSTASAKYDETVEIAFRLGVDPRKADQMVRGTVNLPHGTGKTARVLVFANGDKAEAAKAAGADFVGSDDLLEKVAGGWLDFDAVVATPDLMGKVGRLGKVLGPRGLMPNPKTGTVTMDTAKAVTDIKGGKIEFRVDKHGNLHFIIGKISFDEKALVENYATALDEVLRLKPASSKGRYIAKATLATTMGPGIPLDYTRTRNLLEDTVEA